MMKKNDLIELTIDGASSDGAGIGRAEGAAVFVPGAAIGDRCRVRIVKVEKNLFRGRLEQILVPSPNRITPACLSAGKFGG